MLMREIWGFCQYPSKRYRSFNAADALAVLVQSALTVADGYWNARHQRLSVCCSRVRGACLASKWGLVPLIAPPLARWRIDLISRRYVGSSGTLQFP